MSISANDTVADVFDAVFASIRPAAAAAESVEGMAAALAPLTSAIHDAISSGERVDLGFSLHPLQLDDERADWADAVIDQAVEEALGRMPILRVFARARPVRVLSGLAELSFVAGREGDDEYDWWMEADEALIDAFGFEKLASLPNGRNANPWLDSARAALKRAFQAGRAQREIDIQSAPSKRSLDVARAYAVIYRDECEFPGDTCPSAVDSAVARVAYKLAERHPVTAAEAAHAAMAAFRQEGMRPSIEVAEHALNRGRAGCEQRAAYEEDAAEREVETREAVLRILGDVA